MQDSGFQVLLQGNNFLRILQGLGVTIGISIVSVLLSLAFFVTYLSGIYSYHAPVSLALHCLFWSG